MRYASLLTVVLALAACEDHSHHRHPHGPFDGSTLWDLPLDADSLDAGLFPVASYLFPAELRLIPDRGDRYAVDFFGWLDFELFDSYTNWPAGFLSFDLRDLNGQTGEFVHTLPGTPFGFFDYWGGLGFYTAAYGFTEVDFQLTLSPRNGTLENSRRADVWWRADLRSYGGPGQRLVEAHFQGFQTVALRLDP